jgi:hypothetical protein
MELAIPLLDADYLLVNNQSDIHELPPLEPVVHPSIDSDTLQPILNDTSVPIPVTPSHPVNFTSVMYRWHTQRYVLDATALMDRCPQYQELTYTTFQGSHDQLLQSESYQRFSQSNNLFRQFILDCRMENRWYSRSFTQVIPIDEHTQVIHLFKLCISKPLLKKEWEWNIEYRLIAGKRLHTCVPIPPEEVSWIRRMVIRHLNIDITHLSIQIEREKPLTPERERCLGDTLKQLSKWRTLKLSECQIRTEVERWIVKHVGDVRLRSECLEMALFLIRIG